MKKISLSSWAIPQPLDQLVAGAKKIGYDGISLGGFPPFGAHPDLVDTQEKKDALVKLFRDSGMEVADYALDMWKYDSLKMTEEWRAEYTRALKLAKELNLTDIMRVDTCTPPVVPMGTSPSVPWSMCQSTSSRILSKSTRSPLNGVTMATRLP